MKPGARTFPCMQVPRPARWPDHPDWPGCAAGRGPGIEPEPSRAGLRRVYRDFPTSRLSRDRIAAPPCAVARGPPPRDRRAPGGLWTGGAPLPSLRAGSASACSGRCPALAQSSLGRGPPGDRAPAPRVRTRGGAGTGSPVVLPALRQGPRPTLRAGRPWPPCSGGWAAVPSPWEGVGWGRGKARMGAGALIAAWVFIG